MGYRLYITSLLLSCSLIHAFSPDIRADSNRDGIVDLDGNTDAINKDLWTEGHGAIFLPNIGDSKGRCYFADRRGEDFSDVELASCNDASGDTLINPKYVAPLRTMPIHDIGNNAKGHIASDAPSYVRIFWKHGSEWTFIDPEFIFNASTIRTGLELGIDSRALVTDSDIWNGTVRVSFTVTDGDATKTDQVALKLSPVFLHHHLQPAQHLITVLANDATAAQQRFVKQLDEAKSKAGLNTPLTLLSSTDDFWAQDLMEPAFASMPGPNGPISIRVILRTAQNGRPASRQVFTQLRGQGIGGFQPVGKGVLGWREINSGGNIETIPPYTSKKTGKHYPLGRILTGRHFEEQPSEAMMTFFRSQELQDPLVIEAGWLAVGHVDEFMSFLPADNELGFTLAVSDPVAGLNVLRKANESGHGNVDAYSVNLQDWTPPQGAEPNLNWTISQVVSDEVVLHATARAQKNIDTAVNILLEEIGLTKEDLIRIPHLFTDSEFSGPGHTESHNGLPPHMSPPKKGEFNVASFYPAAINGVLVGDSFICSRAFGPIIDGKDIFQEAVEDAYSKSNVTVRFIDDFWSHHINGGDVHCGSNTLRDMTVSWWNQL
ncbi:Protein-arginine deiminase PAD [Aspergillus sclerotialis]|uniref:Protein-arginine deiminase PAD n=1 Tax=Aspergillus sclerotialis TaxID=2070753 RepID=A0A3A2ZUZ5_9EURO|nr:Protein-arginine deiminase PAD [Aspergillus sclerotialis]